MSRWMIAQFFEKRWKRKMTRKLGLEGYLELLGRNAYAILRFYGLTPTFKGKKVLEVGCGFAGLISVVDAKLKVGVDPLIAHFPNMSGFRYEAIYTSLKAEDLDQYFEPDFFDVVFCSNTLNHLDNPEDVLRNIWLLLRQKGQLFLDVHIQRKSLIHPHSFTAKTLRPMIETRFAIDKEFCSSTAQLFGVPNCKVWGCKAIKKEAS